MMAFVVVDEYSRKSGKEEIGNLLEKKNVVACM